MLSSRPPHPRWSNHPNSIRWRIKAVKFNIMQSSPLLGPNFLLSTLFSKSPCSSLKPRSHTVPLTKLVLYISIFRFFYMRRGTRGSFPGGKSAGTWSWPLTSI
jgi:hypothetical protein